jgi:hypothetical protein
MAQHNSGSLPDSVADAVKTGRIAGLEAIRDKLAADLDEASPQVSAQLSAQLRATLAELEELKSGDEGSWLDELAARRTAAGNTGTVEGSAARRITKRQA